MTTTDAGSTDTGTGAAETNGSARRPANRRDLILHAAIDLFHQRGYPATSVDDIGKAVDVSGPAIHACVRAAGAEVVYETTSCFV